MSLDNFSCVNRGIIDFRRFRHCCCKHYVLRWRPTHSKVRKETLPDTFFFLQVIDVFFLLFAVRITSLIAVGHTKMVFVFKKNL